MRQRVATAAVGCLLAACGAALCAGPARAGGHAAASAAAYCTQTHGLLEKRRPLYGEPSAQRFLAGRETFCRYTSAVDGSRLYVLASTLYARAPTMAALAYLGRTAPGGSCRGNPASCYCSQLGGSDQLAGGGWYDGSAIDSSLQLCVFADMSAIDSWALIYHARAIVRGIDLARVLRYQAPTTQ